MRTSCAIGPTDPCWFALIPAEWHADAPLRQRMALVRGAGETARAFYAYLQGFSARDTLARHGFSLPAE